MEKYENIQQQLTALQLSVASTAAIKLTRKRRTRIKNNAHLNHTCPNLSLYSAATFMSRLKSTKNNAKPANSINNSFFPLVLTWQMKI
jgi:hypothetical protein